MSLNGQVVHTDEFGVTIVLSDQEALERFGTTREQNDNSTIPEQKTYLQHIRLYHGSAPQPLKVGLGALSKMAQSCSSPAVAWAILAASISLGVGIAMSLVYGSILQTSFHWSGASIGLVNAGILPAAIIAMLWSGFIGDKINLWLARRRNGTHIPEDTLVILIMPTLVSAVGIVIFAVTAMWPQTHSSWGIVMGEPRRTGEASVPCADFYIGWTFFEFGFLSAIITTTHFASEAYP
jgi:hypothetical protein